MNAVSPQTVLYCDACDVVKIRLLTAFAGNTVHAIVCAVNGTVNSTVGEFVCNKRSQSVACQPAHATDDGVAEGFTMLFSLY